MQVLDATSLLQIIVGGPNRLLVGPPQDDPPATLPHGPAALVAQTLCTFAGRSALRRVGPPFRSLAAGQARRPVGGRLR